MKVTKIFMQYFEDNDKWYLYLNNTMVGKFYSFEEVMKLLPNKVKRFEQ